MRFVPLTLLVLFSNHAALVAASNPGQTPAPSGSPAARHRNQSNELRSRQAYESSLKELNEIIQKSPGVWEGYDLRANFFIEHGNWPAALQDLNSTIRLEPAFFEASWKRSIVYLRLHHYAASLKDLDALAKVTFQTQNTGELALTLSQRAWIRAACPDGSFRNGKAALQDAKKACDLTKFENDDQVDTLAAAYAEGRDFDSAVRYEQQAIALRSSERGRDLQELAKYKQKHHDQKEQQEADEFVARLAKGDKAVIYGYTRRLEMYKHHQSYHGPL